MEAYKITPIAIDSDPPFARCHTPMNQWFLSKGDGQEGPFTAKQIAAIHSLGEFDAETAHAWKEGMPEWLPVSTSGVLAEAAEVPVSSIPQPTIRPVIAESPYTPPKAANGGLYSERQSIEIPLEYPGIGRLAYFLWSMGLNVAAYAAMFLLAVVLVQSADSGSPMVVFLLLILLVGAGGIYLAVLRARNLGMSGVAALWCFVPVMNFWMAWRLMACPAGYHDHESLDTAGKVVSILMGLLIVLPILLSLGLAMFG